MSETFLSRWSRRKRENTSPRLRGESLPSGSDPRVDARSASGEGGSPDAQAVESPRHPDPLPASGEREKTPPTPDPSPPTSAQGEGNREAVPFDPATLPPIESIGAGTDVSAFLRPGVPADLARAALRRAWVADPAIRDFVGLAENAWDFNAPGGVPGFEPLRAIDDVQRLAAQIIGAVPAAVPDSDAEQKTEVATTSEVAPQHAAAPAASDEAAPLPADDAATQSDVRIDNGKTAGLRHGGALPE